MSAQWVRTGEGLAAWLDAEQWPEIEVDAPEAPNPWDDTAEDVTLTESQRAFLRQLAEQGAPPRPRDLEDPLVFFDDDPRTDGGRTD